MCKGGGGLLWEIALNYPLKKVEGPVLSLKIGGGFYFILKWARQCTQTVVLISISKSEKNRKLIDQKIDYRKI